MNMDDSIEYKVLQAYAEKKKHTHSLLPQINGTSVGKPVLPVPSEKQHKTEKNRRKKIKFSNLIRCIRPVKEDDVSVTEDYKHQPATDSRSKQEVENIVNKLTKITDSVHFLPTELETDTGKSDVDRIVEILREQGDKLDEKIKKDHKLMQELQSVLSYNYFENIAKVFFWRLDPEELPPAQQPKQSYIALICELTSRLNAMDSHPMNRVLGFGAQYLRELYGSWVTEQGGYGEVFSTVDDPEEEFQRT